MSILAVRIDRQARTLDDAVISVADDGLLRGDGVFEVLRVYAGRLFAVDEHIDRMVHSAVILRLPFDAAAAREEALELAMLADKSDALIRLVQTRGGRMIALLENLPPMPEAVRLATIVYGPTVILDGVKSISYAANALATRLAVERGAHQALFISPDGHVLEGPNFAAFFALGEDEHFCTPPLSDGILDSITRRHLMGLVPVEERRIGVDELPRVTEAFIASTVRDVLPVSHLADATLLGARGRLASNASALFNEHVRSGAHTLSSA